MKRQVWINMNTGEFSNSWDKPEEESVFHSFLLETRIKANEEGWKLIEYECLNDREFQFTDWMQILTSKKKLNNDKAGSHTSNAAR
jgi:hypothetical protein